MRVGEVCLFPVSSEQRVRERILELAGDEAVRGQMVDDDAYVWKDGKFS